MALPLLLLFLFAWMIPFSVQDGETTDPVPVFRNEFGLSYHPIPPRQDSYENNLIYYKAKEAAGEKNFTYWTKKLDSFLRVYKITGLLAGRGQNIVNCDYEHPPAVGQVCDVNVRRWHPCTKENNYNYHRSAPCIFLKLDTELQWRPDYYNDTRNLPTQMPDDLKDNIITEKNYDPRALNTVWVSCKGETPVDEENIGPIQYIPRRGFPGYYFPVTTVEGYLSPLVAVFFERPMVGIVISIECKAWAGNINNGQMENRGSVHFELLVD